MVAALRTAHSSEPAGSSSAAASAHGSTTERSDFSHRVAPDSTEPALAMEDGTAADQDVFAYLLRADGLRPLDTRRRDRTLNPATLASEHEAVPRRGVASLF